MGRPFQEKYAGVQWEVDEAKFDAWKDGMTGYPIIDAVSILLHNFHHLLFSSSGYAST